MGEQALEDVKRLAHNADVRQGVERLTYWRNVLRFHNFHRPLFPLLPKNWHEMSKEERLEFKAGLKPFWQHLKWRRDVWKQVSYAFYAFKLKGVWAGLELERFLALDGNWMLTLHGTALLFYKRLLKWMEHTKVEREGKVHYFLSSRYERRVAFAAIANAAAQRGTDWQALWDVVKVAQRFLSERKRFFITQRKAVLHSALTYLHDAVKAKV